MDGPAAMAVIPLAIPLAALLISVATFVLTSRRAQQTDERAAAKETVDLLARRLDVLTTELAEVRSRLHECEVARDRLVRENLDFMRRLVGPPSTSSSVG